MCRLSDSPGRRAGAGPGGQPVPRRHQPRRFAAADAAVDTTLHAGRIHRVRDPRARAAPPSASAFCRKKRESAPPSSSTRRAAAAKDPASKSSTRAPASPAVHLRTGQNDPETHAIHAKLPMPVPARRHRPRADLQNLQGSAHVHDARRRHRLGAEPERVSPRRAAAERLRVRLVERGRAALDERGWTAEARVCQSEWTEQPGDDPRAPNIARRLRPRRPPTCFSTM